MEKPIVRSRHVEIKFEFGIIMFALTNIRLNRNCLFMSLFLHQPVSVEVWVPIGTCHVTRMVDSAYALNQLRGWTAILAVNVTFALSIRTKHQTDVQVRIHVHNYIVGLYLLMYVQVTNIIRYINMQSVNVLICWTCVTS